jgi:hypothetical protein
MTEALICDAIRTPIGRYGVSLSAVRADRSSRNGPQANCFS